MRAVDGFVRVFAPVLVAVGLAAIVGSSTTAGIFLVSEGIVFAALGGVIAWTTDRQRARIAKVLSERMTTAAVIRGEALRWTKDGSSLDDIRSRMAKWKEDTRATVETWIPGELPQWDAPVLPRSHPYGVPYASLGEIANDLDERIELLRTFLTSHS